MISYLLDTTVFIGHLRGHVGSREYFDKMGGEVGLSYVTLGELIQGIRSQKHRTQIDNLLFQCEVIWGSRTIEKNALILLQEQVLRGMDFYDALIAATAIENDLTLVTHNLKHFQGIEGLQVIAPPYLD